jgi:cellulose synthase/poly-beta-1,6-N-acetylglucosamine synthase-like glycosyltransferase
MSTNTMGSPASPIRLSIIVPVHNNPGDLAACLAALRAAAPPASEIIVVDDASTDATPAVAAAGGARVLRLGRNSGPAAARNHGAEHARGDVLLFVDADVVVAPGAIGRVEETFAKDPRLSAVFGSYDSRPPAPGLVSRYRNLLHHFVHQEGRTAAATFWAGLGAVRRAVFLEVGGFDAARFRRPSIEDIELGYRLRRAGHAIRLDKGLQGTHLKQWRLWAMIRTDVTCRALPWARLVLETGDAPEDLNLRPSQRVSAALAGLALLTAAAAPLRAGFLGASVLALLGVAAINHRLYGLLLRQGGLRLAALGFVLHVLYFLYSAAAYLYAWLEWRVRGAAAALARVVRV